MTHATLNHSRHSGCGGTLMIGHVEGEEYTYCDRCGAFAYQGHDLHDGPADKDAAERAWDRAEMTSQPATGPMEVRQSWDGSVTVADPAGGVWTPSADALEEIQASDSPTATAIRIVTETPMRGAWRS